MKGTIMIDSPPIVATSWPPPMRIVLLTEVLAVLETAETLDRVHESWIRCRLEDDRYGVASLREGATCPLQVTTALSEFVLAYDALQKAFLAAKRVQSRSLMQMLHDALDAFFTRRKAGIAALATIESHLIATSEQYLPYLNSATQPRLIEALHRVCGAKRYRFSERVSAAIDLNSALRFFAGDVAQGGQP